MAYQTTYNERIAPPGPGVVAGQMDNARSVTGICETASPGIPFGRVVSRGTLSDQGVVIGGSLAGLLGITIRDDTLRGDQTVVDAYLPPNSVGVLQDGEIWVEPTVAVNAGDPVWFSATTGQLNKSTGIGPVPEWQFKTSCGVGGRAVVSITAGKKG